MSAKASECVWEHSPYTLAKRLVHLAVAKCTAENRGHYIWASQSWIAERAKVDRKTANTALAEMIRDGWLKSIEWDELPADIQMLIPDRRTRIYRFLLCERCGQHWGLPGRGESSDTSTWGISSPDVGNLETRHGESTDLVLLPITNNPIEQKNSRVESFFAAAWEHYPRKTGRKAAFNAFTARLNEGIPALDLQRAVTNYETSCRANHTEKQFIMQGSTFFGPNERWKDYIQGPILDEDHRARNARRPRTAAVQAFLKGQYEQNAGRPGDLLHDNPVAELPPS